MYLLKDYFFLKDEIIEIPKSNNFLNISFLCSMKNVKVVCPKKASTNIPISIFDFDIPFDFITRINIVDEKEDNTNNAPTFFLVGLIEFSK